MSHCHTIDPTADLHSETMRIKLGSRPIDEREDATLEQLFCIECGHVLHTAWREKLWWLWFGRMTPAQAMEAEIRRRLADYHLRGVL